MKIFVTGAAGQLGRDVTAELENRGHNVVRSDIVQDEDNRYGGSYISLDITDEMAVEECLNKIRPEAVIHCAAWTAVDAAEEESNREKVYAINVKGTENIARACKKISAKMIYISTDYVFDGQGERPWEPEDKQYAPLNYYGKTKLAGEHAVVQTLEKFFIVRIAWVFGKNGKNFVKTMLELGKKYEKLRIVCDQIGTPTYTYDLAKLLADMIETEKYGYYHATNEGEYISWYAYAKEIFAEAVRRGQLQYEENRLVVEPVTTEEYGQSKALRPFNSR
ncbi:MAG: dTDP-4-dehydrorhamnose reductase, partial [Oscillospiraceae bacterium]|nr:dTDP-4-dehydrorhamnose reductase [Oscillospiraceae bacterium]